MDYNPFQIYQLIKNSLTLQEFNNLVYFYFPAVYSQFTDGQIQDTRIILLIDYCDKHQELPKLLEKIGEINPQAVIKFMQSSPSITESMNQSNDRENYLMYIDFKSSVDIFKEALILLKSQRLPQAANNPRVDFALFFLEDSLTKKGDLYLQRIQEELKSKIHSPEPEIFRPCSVKYTSGDLTNVIQKIATFFKVKSFEEISIQEKISFKEYVNLVINQMAQSLINNSVVLIDIFCDLNDASDIDLFIPWFIKTFWNPLTEKIENLIGDYEDIKIIAIINSDWPLKERLVTEELVPYLNNNNKNLCNNKLTHIPLYDWEKDDIANGIKALKPSLTVTEREEKASQIYGITKGSPQSVCQAFKKYGIL